MVSRTVGNKMTDLIYSRGHIMACNGRPLKSSWSSADLSSAAPFNNHAEVGREGVV